MPASQMIAGDMVSEHPAFKAWTRLHRGEAAPTRIEVLRQERRKTRVYRLSGLGTAKEGVVAKRSYRRYVEMERKIYEDILPSLPVSSLRYYGSIDDDDPKYGWLFVENASGRAYTSRLRTHRVVAGKWLGILHTSSASHVDEFSKLPDRGPQHYLERLRSARHWIERSLDLELESVDPDSRRSIISDFDDLEGRWNELLGFCGKLPRTLVHGDFSERNIRIRAAVPSRGLPILVAFDWSEAGWGVPPVDILGRFRHGVSHSGEPDLDTYWSVVRKLWKIPSIETIRKFETVGKTFRAIAAIDWRFPLDEARNSGESSLAKADWIGNISHLRLYELWLRECLKEIRKF